jgi:hypothetical protein
MWHGTYPANQMDFSQRELYKRHILLLVDDVASCDACKMHTWTLWFIILNSHVIETYMIIIACFTLIYGDLPMISFIWFITLQNRNSLFCVFFHFQRPIQSQIELEFRGRHFSPEEARWAFGAHLERPDGQKRPGGTP